MNTELKQLTYWLIRYLPVKVQVYNHINILEDLLFWWLGQTRFTHYKSINYIIYLNSETSNYKHFFLYP